MLSPQQVKWLTFWTQFKNVFRNVPEWLWHMNLSLKENAFVLGPVHPKPLLSAEAMGHRAR